ncbi:GTPase IMAP member 4 [Actinomortierella wolfii]|nr:GTPase IMAP member 4 [Actinomortierella wolfii]
MTRKEYSNPHAARFAHIVAAIKKEDFKLTDSENVIVVGKTGSGKSSVISLLIGKDAGVGHGLNAKTMQTKEFDLHLPAKYGDRNIKLIDTRGVLDKEGSLTSLLESLIDNLTGRFYHVNTIMLVLGCERLTKETEDALTCLCKTFGLNDVERSRRLLIVVTKVEHLKTEEQEKVFRSIVEHSIFTNLGISKEYLRQNTIQVFAASSEGLNPHLAMAYDNMRVESKDRLLGKLAQKNSPMTVSNDFAQKLTNAITENIETIETAAVLTLELLVKKAIAN